MGFQSPERKRSVAGVVALIWIAALAASCGSGDSPAENCRKDGGCSDVLVALKVSGDIPLSANDPFWSSDKGPKKIAVELGPQLMTNPQWPDPSIQKVSLKAARNDFEIAIFAEWEDAAENADSTPGVGYTDQIAVMFPVNPRKELPPITMGGEGGEVNIWQWKAVWQRALAQGGSDPAGAGQGGASPSFPPERRVSSVEDLNAEGFSTLTRQERQNVAGNGLWGGKKWRVVFKRSLTDADSNDVQFGSSTPMAVAVWDGGNRETNGQKGISNWILLNLS